MHANKRADTNSVKQHFFDELIIVRFRRGSFLEYKKIRFSSLLTDGKTENERLMGDQLLRVLLYGCKLT